MKLIYSIFIALALAVLFYFPYFNRHLVPVPLDIVPGMYLPWLDKTIPVKNPLPSDVVSLTLPLRYSAITLMKSSQWPLWNSQIISGTPLLANFQSAAFNPINILYLLSLKFIDIWSIQVIFQSIFAYIFFYLFISLFVKNKLACIFGSFIWAFNGFFILWFQYNTVVYAALYLPLVIYAIVKLSKNILWGFLISLALSFSIFSGNPPVSMIIMAASVLFSIMYYRTNLKKVLLVILFMFISLLYASPQLIPGLESSKTSMRNEDNIALSSNIKYLPPIRLLTMITPDIFGNPTTRNTWIDHGLYDNLTIYNGILSIFLFLISFKLKFSKKYKNLIQFAYLLSIISFLIMLPNFLSKYIGSITYFGLSTMVFSRLSLLWSFSLAIISSLTISYLVSNKIKLSKIILPIIIIPLATSLLFLITFIVNKYFTSLQFIDYDWLNQTKVAYRNCLYPIMFSMAVFISLITLISIKNKKIKTIILFIVFFINIFDLYRFFNKYNSFSPTKYFFPQSEALDYLQKNSFRFARESAEIIPSNMWMMYPNLKTATGYDTTYSQNYAHYMSLVNSNNLTGSNNRFLEVNNFNSPLINHLAIDHILATKKDKYILSEKGVLASDIKSANFKLVKDYGYYQLLKNSNSLPFIRPIKEIITATDISEIQKLLLSSNSNNIAIIGENINTGKDLDSNISISDINIESQSFHFKTTSSNQNYSFVVISQNFDKGWKVFVDSKISPLYRTNYTFTGLLLPPGDHEVNMVYMPDSFNISIYLSIISILLSLLTIIIITIWHRFHHN